RLLVALRRREIVADALRRSVADRRVDDVGQVELLAHEGVARHAKAQLVVNLILRPHLIEEGTQTGCGFRSRSHGPNSRGRPLGSRSDVSGRGSGNSAARV